MSLENVIKIVENALGVDPFGEEDRQPIIDILMDYLNNPKCEEYIYESLKTFIPEKFSYLQLAAMIGDVQHLKAGETDDDSETI